MIHSGEVAFYRWLSGRTSLASQIPICFSSKTWLLDLNPLYSLAGLDMQQTNNPKKTIFFQHIWDRTVRIFHWLNVLCVIGLIAIGLIILNSKSFGVGSDGKILLKTIHVYIGYAFTVNLSWRLIWGFFGSASARWAAILPLGKRYRKSLVGYLSDIREKRTKSYVAHNPLGRLMISFLYLLLISQAVTGLVLAGTDLYFPPFGSQIEEWVRDSSSAQSSEVALTPGSKEGVNAAAYAQMRSFRKPFVRVHEYGFYLLLAAIMLHIAGVVYAEVTQRNGLVSAMISGKKVFTEKPVDLDQD
jgi:Ni/Fe-hydrogenase 1 B-type cytochrome subunit